MSATIWKWTLHGTRGGEYLALPKGAQILSVGLQGPHVCLWAMVDPAERIMESRRIESYGTGHDIAEPDGLRFIGTTVDMDGSPLVFHHFERVSP